MTDATQLVRDAIEWVHDTYKDTASEPTVTPMPLYLPTQPPTQAEPQGKPIVGAYKVTITFEVMAEKDARYAP